MILLLVAVGLVIGVGMSLINTDAYDSATAGLRWKLLFIVLLFFFVLAGIQYRITRSVGCLPFCMGVSFVDRDFTNRDFSNANFVEAYMPRINFTNASLLNSDLSGADLQNSILKGADLRFTFFLGSNLTGADLGDVDLTDASLQGADLTGANLSGVDLSQTVLVGATLNGATLVGVDLSYAILSGIKMQGADLSGADLRGADLSGATLSQANLSGANLQGAKLNGAFINLATLTGADLTSATLSGASLIGSNLASVNLRDASLVGALVMGTNFDGADLRGASLQYVRDVEQVNRADIALDPVLAELNTLQLGAISIPSSLQGILTDANTQASADLVPISARDQEPINQELVHVGMLFSVSGADAFDESAILDATLLAINEINAAGGVLDHYIVPIAEDGASDPDVFRDKAEKLLTIDEVDVVFGVGTTGSRKAVLPVFEENRRLLFYPVQYEGIENSDYIFYLGADPSQRLIPTIEYLLEEGYQTFYVVGSDNRFTDVIHELIVAQLAESEARVVGESFVALGETDVEAAVSDVAFLKPSIVINTLVGASNQAFFAGLDLEQINAATTPVLSLVVGEIDIPGIGLELAAGHLTAQSYIQTVDTSANFTFLEAYKAENGRDALVSDAIVSGYTAVYLWKRLVEEAGSFAADDLQAVAQSGAIELETPNGVLQLDADAQQLAQPLRIGRIRADGLIDQIAGSDGNIPPDPFLTQYPWATDTVTRFMRESNP